MLGRLEELAGAGVDFDLVPVRLAAWFHDGIYDGERDAEERSATWAETVLADLVTGAGGRDRPIGAADRDPPTR